MITHKEACESKRIPLTKQPTPKTYELSPVTMKNKYSPIKENNSANYSVIKMEFLSGKDQTNPNDMKRNTKQNISLDSKKRKTKQGPRRFRRRDIRTREATSNSKNKFNL